MLIVCEVILKQKQGTNRIYARTRLWFKDFEFSVIKADMSEFGLLMFLIPQQNLDDTKFSAHVHRRFAPVCPDACILSSIKEFALERYKNSEILYAHLSERHLGPED